MSLRLMPLCMCASLYESISQALRKRMQGKTRFNFKSGPGKETLMEPERLTRAEREQWT